METDTAQRVLAYVRSCYRAHGVPPTIREVNTALDLHSIGNVQRHLLCLTASGLLRRAPMGGARSWVPLGVVPDTALTGSHDGAAFHRPVLECG